MKLPDIVRAIPHPLLLLAMAAPLLLAGGQQALERREKEIERQRRPENCRDFYLNTSWHFGCPHRIHRLNMLPDGNGICRCERKKRK